MSFICNAFALKCDSLYAQGDYFEASVEYERMIFRGKNQADINHYKYKKALCYKKMGQFERALNELQPIYFSDASDSLFRFVSFRVRDSALAGIL